jgi:hypothetical protein
VFPASIIIPPHEYRHVTLAFLPKALQHYVATFEAAVVGGAADPATAAFTCELRGEGALPSLSFQVCVEVVGGCNARGASHAALSCLQATGAPHLAACANTPSNTHIGASWAGCVRPAVAQVWAAAGAVCQPPAAHQRAQQRPAARHGSHRDGAAPGLPAGGGHPGGCMRLGLCVPAALVSLTRKCRFR